MSKKQYLIDFAEWAKETYKSYGDTYLNVISIALKYEEMGYFKEFEEYFKGHFNHAFGDWCFEYYCWDHCRVMARVIEPKLSGEAKEVLCQAAKGPIFDGDVVSKNGKSELYKHQLMLRVMNNNQHGDNAVNQLGYCVFELLTNK
jgi:hypothetical protein